MRRRSIYCCSGIVLLFFVVVLLYQDHDALRLLIVNNTSSSSRINQKSNNNNLCKDDDDDTSWDYDVCFLVSVYGPSTEECDRPVNVESWPQEKTNFTTKFFAYTNLIDLHAPGWEVIVRPQPAYSRYITQSRWPKFMSWMDSTIQRCQAVIYLDAYYELTRMKDHPEAYLALAKQARSSSLGFLQIKHRRRNHNPIYELDRIVQNKKDTQDNVQITKNWLQAQPDFNPKATLYHNTVIVFNPKSCYFQQAANLFWARYSSEQGSWRDQPLWSYVLDKLHFKPDSFPKDDYFMRNVRNMGHSDHTYTGKAATSIIDKSSLLKKNTVIPSGATTSSGDGGNKYTVDAVHNIGDEVSKCQPKSQEEIEHLKKEIQSYEKSQRFFDKIEEAKGNKGLAAHHQAISKFFRNELLQDNWAVLELGCAAGIMLLEVQRAYEADDQLSQPRHLVGVELVTGWVEWAQSYYPVHNPSIHIYEGDITEFNLPDIYTTFDFVMLNDVAEHIMQNRYGCFFTQLQKVTHEGSVVYMHTPTPSAQLVDEEQYIENVLPHHHLITGMALAGFELVTFEHDIDTICSPINSKLPHHLRKSRCNLGGWTKYYHVVFVRRKDSQVFTLK